MARLIDPFEQFFDSDGKPLINGKLDFFESGSSTVRKNTFADVGMEIPNPNPVILNADGRCPNVFGEGSYRAVLNTSPPVVRDPVGGDQNLSFASDWNAELIYSINDVVFEDGQYWISISDNNQNNQPSEDDGSNWEPVSFGVGFGEEWFDTLPYSIDDVAYEDGRYWMSLVGNNQNNQPSTDDSSNWSQLTFSKKITAVKTDDTSRSNTIISIADPDLQMTLDENAIYKISGFLSFDSPASSNGVRIVVIDNSTGILVGRALGSYRNTDNLNTDPGQMYLFFEGVERILSESSSVDFYFKFEGMITTNNSPSRVWDIAWSQDTSTASPTTLLAGSWITAERIDT